MKLLSLLFSAGMMLPLCAALAQRAPSIVPELRVYKPGFVMGEDIEFILGLKGVSREQVAAMQKEGKAAEVVIENPKGKTISYPVDLRFGGLGTHYILGYNRLTKDAVFPGRYRLTFKLAGQSAPTVTVRVADMPILHKIQASLRLESAANFPQSLATTQAVFTIQNNTDVVIRFPRLKPPEGLQVSVRGKSGAWENYTFDTGWGSSRTTDTKFNVDEFTWDAAEALPTVTLKPGEKFEQTLSLQPILDSYMDAYKKDLPVPPGQYEVTLRRSLNVLIGERKDANAIFFPVRMPVSVTALFTAEKAQ